MHAARYAGAAITVFLAASALTPTPRAYSTSRATWDGSPVAYYVNPANHDVSPSAALAAVQAAAAVWSTQTNASIELLYLGQVNDTSIGYDGRNVVIFRDEDKGSTIAGTYSWFSGGTRLDSDVIFYDGGWDFFTGSSGCYRGAYIEDVGAHEFGHVLGLAHSEYTTATMYRRYTRCSTEFRVLDPDDIAGMEFLYPPAEGSTSSNAPPTVDIANPGDSTSFDEGTSVAFSGTATDSEDGDLTAELVWMSDLDGQIGTGGSFLRELSVGSHAVTATVTDSGGLRVAASVTMAVEPVTSVNVTVTGLSPNVVNRNVGLVTFIITGTDFANGVDVAFKGGNGPAPRTQSVTWVSSTQLSAQVEIRSGGPPRERLWDLRVTNPDGSTGVGLALLRITP